MKIEKKNAKYVEQANRRHKYVEFKKVTCARSVGAKAATAVAVFDAGAVGADSDAKTLVSPSGAMAKRSAATRSDLHKMGLRSYPASVATRSIPHEARFRSYPTGSSEIMLSPDADSSITKTKCSVFGSSSDGAAEVINGGLMLVVESSGKHTYQVGIQLEMDLQGRNPALPIDDIVETNVDTEGIEMGCEQRFGPIFGRDIEEGLENGFGGNNGDRFGELAPVKSWKALFSMPAKTYGPLQLSRPHKSDGKFVVKPPEEAVMEGIDMWKGCLVGQFLDKRLPFPMVRSLVNKLWGKKEMPDISTTKHGLYFFRFRDLDARDWVMESGPWHLAGRPFILRAWRPGMDMINIQLTSIPIWVKFYNIPLEY